MNNKFVWITTIVLTVLVSYTLGKSQSVGISSNKPVLSKSVCDEILSQKEITPVTIFEGTPTKLNFSEDAWLNQFRTTVSEQYSKGPNFAGHFSFVSWGCGTECISYAIIDSKTGKRVRINGSEVVENLSPSFEINSRLLVFNTKEGNNNLKGKTLKQILDEDPFWYSSKGREYYEIIEESDGHIWLHKLCTENVLDGIYIN